MFYYSHLSTIPKYKNKGIKKTFLEFSGRLYLQHSET